MNIQRRIEILEKNASCVRGTTDSGGSVLHLFSVNNYQNQYTQQLDDMSHDYPNKEIDRWASLVNRI
jgi:hypothetical protein